MYTIIKQALLLVGTLFMEVTETGVRIGKGFISTKNDETQGKACHSPKGQFKLTKEEAQALYNALGELLPKWEKTVTKANTETVKVTKDNALDLLNKLDLEHVFYTTASKLPPNNLVGVVKEYIAAGIPFKETKARKATGAKPKVTKKSKGKSIAKDLK